MDDVKQSRPMKYLESTFLTILSEIQKRPLGHPQITLKRPVREPSRPRAHIVERQVTYRWPGKTKDEAWRFACVGRILAEIHDALQRGIVITKREIFYRDPELFRKQGLVDRYVDDIAYTCNVTRQDLNVTASAKGLHAGLGRTGESFDTVPDSVSHLSELPLDHLRWILVVEKEATFRSLLEKHFHRDSVNGHGLLLTAKGYPDLATRRFLRALCDHTTWSPSRRLPIFGLFDADPDGVNIMQIYRRGSRSLPHEMETSVPEMTWLGVHVGDTRGQVEDETVLRLTARDRKKALAMLLRVEQQKTDRTDDECTIELQKMLMQNIKAEIQLWEDRPGGLERWLDRRIQRQLSKRDTF